MSHRLRDLFLSAAKLHEQADLDGAEAIYRRIHQEFPANADALHMLGIVAHQRGDNHAAAGLIIHAIEFNPFNVQYRITLAAVWTALECYSQLEQTAAAVLKMDPRNADMASAAAAACLALNKPDAAADYARLALSIDPDRSSAHADLADALSLQGDSDASLAQYRKALELDPSSAQIHSGIIFAMQRSDRFTPADVAAELQRWNHAHASAVPRIRLPPRAAPSPGRRPRIGWVSPDFRFNVVGRCMLPLFRAFAPESFEHFAFSSVTSPDEFTELIRGSVPNWRDISAADDEQAAETIASDQIDVLVDLSLHCDFNRLLLFARKPAPIQLTYLSYPGSSGLSTMDYRISSPRLDPPGTDLSLYPEKTLLLDGSYFCYRPHGQFGDLTPPPSAQNGFITFGSLVEMSKLSESALNLWARVLRQVPRSRFILSAPSDVLKARLREFFQNAGVDPQRIEFVGRLTWVGYVQTLNRIDIFLDAVVSSAGITACDCLWMGLPIVTLKGDRATRRMCFSILHDAAHPDWAAQTPDQYVQIAASLAADPSRLAQLRSSLRPEIQSSPLMNGAAIARDLERLLQEALRNTTPR